MFFVALGLVSFQFIGSVLAVAVNFSLLGELNGDNKVDYGDSVILERHLIHLEQLDEKYLENADMNSDGKITITDLTLLIQKLEKSLDYEANLSNSNTGTIYAQKGEKVTFNFYAHVSYGMTVSSVVIDKNTYPVQKSNDSEEYTFELNMGSDIGKKEITIKEVVLNNGKKVKTNLVIPVEVLKDKPTIENYFVDEDINASKVSISFNIFDKDKSLTKAQLYIYNDEDTLIQEKSAQSGNNFFELYVEDGKEYKIIITLGYNLTTGASNDQYAKTVSIEKKLKFNIDYQFKFSDINIYKDKVKVTELEKGQTFELGFVSSNATNYEPNVVRINGKVYQITSKEDNRYFVILPAYSQLGTYELELEALSLSNGHIFEFDKDNKIKIQVFKRKPTISNFKATETTANNNMNLQFDLQNDDETLNELTLQLLNSKNEVISNVSLSNTELKSGHISKNLDTTITEKYKVKVLASYRQKEEIVKTELYNEEVDAIARVRINDVHIDKKYYEKREDVAMTYTIETNKKVDVKRVRVNYTEYEVEKLSNNKYKIILYTDDIAGVRNLTTSKFIFADDSEAEVNFVSQVEILKNKPSVKDYSHTHVGTKANIQFELIDSDNSFKDGKLVFTKLEDNSTQELEIHKGKNEITVTLEDSKIYDVEIKANYDRDTNTLSENENVIKNEILLAQKLQLLVDYKLQINDLTTSNKAGNTKYFERNESILVQFKSQNASIFTPKYAVINGKKYELVLKNGYYQTEISSFATAGVKDIVIEQIILNNTHVLDVPNTKVVKVDILKKKPEVSKFGYQENEDATISATFNLNDSENSLVEGSIVVQNDQGVTLKTEKVVKGKNVINFDQTTSEFYTFKVYVSYDLDTNTLSTGSNEVKNELMLKDEINTNNRALEMKDITGVTLYKKENSGIQKIYQIPLSELNNLKDLSAYYLKIDMKSIRSFNAAIKTYRVEDNQVYFTVDLENVVQYNGKQKKNDLEIPFGAINEGVVQNIDLETLVELITKNPSGHYKLTMDSDASSISGGTTLIPGEFTGTIDFGGHTIKNLSKPLFHTLKNATIENLVIKDSGATAHGIFAEVIINSTVKNVHLRDVTVTAPDISGTGSFAGRVEQRSYLENVSATGINVGNSKRTGGFIGQIYESDIKNAYIEGYVSSNADGSGGFIGENPGGSKNSIIENVYVNVTTNFGSGTNAGVVGWSRNTTLVNVLSVAKNTVAGRGYTMYGKSLNGYSSTNNYELETSNLISQSSHAKINKVSEADLKTKEFYTKTLGWSEDVWDFSKVSKGEYPTLKSFPEKTSKKPKNDNVYIPNFDRISDLDNYDSKREIAYHNMYKLMPFYDAKYYVADGNKIALDHILNTKIISHIFAYDKNGKWVTALSKTNKNDIKSIRLLFTDNDSVTYSVTFDEDDSRIAYYNIPDLEIGYTYDKYLVDTESRVFKYIVDKVKTLDFNEDLAVLVSGKEKRTTIENYAHVQANAESFALKLIANTPDYNVVKDNSTIEDAIIYELSNNKTIEKLIYAYNHFDRYYNIEIGGINLTDFVYFDGSLFATGLNAIGTSTQFVTSDEGARSTDNLAGYYDSKIKPLTKLNLIDFLEFFIKNLTIDKYKNDPGSWIIDNWDGGVIYEQPAARYPDLRYRVWDHLKARYNNAKLNLLTLLSYHRGDMYLLGVPSTILVGNLRMYFGNNYDTTPYETKLAKLKGFSTPACIYFDTIAGTVEGTNGYNNLKNYTQISFDSTHQKNWTNVENAQDPFKHYYEPSNNYQTKPISAAFANTAWAIWWMDSWALTSFNIYTHESMHNTDDRIFFEGQGSRQSNGSEYYTDGFLTQGASGVTLVPNFLYTYSWVGAPCTTNFSYKRIDTRDKIKDFYKKAFDTYAFMDYLEAQAFLKMSPENQSKLASIISQNGGNTSHATKTAEEFAAMNLKTIEDLFDNKIVNVRSGTANSLYNANWYLPSNSNGSMNKSYTIMTSYQLMGDFGFGAYALYNSYIPANDLDALRRITGDNTMTWKKYQMSRFAAIESQINNFKFFDTNEIINKMTEAMYLDIANNQTRNGNGAIAKYRNLLFGYLKRATSDFETGIFEEVPKTIHVKSIDDMKNALKDKVNVNFVIDKDLDLSNVSVDTATILGDFTGIIYGNNHKITGLTKPLFNNVAMSFIKDLKFENSNIVANGQSDIGIFAKKLQYSEVENVTIENGVTVKGYDRVGAFVGVLNSSTLKNIIIKKANVAALSNGNFIGGVYGSGNSNIIKNVHVFESNVSGRDNIGGIGGYATDHVYISQVTFSGNVSNSNSGVGGLYGKIINSYIENSYTTGKISGSRYVGGLVGVASSVKFDKVFSNINIVRASNTNLTGGIAGDNGVNGSLFNPGITNSVSFGRVTNGYKIFGTSTKEIVESNYRNNYELQSSIGHSSSEKGLNLTNRISTINLADINTKFFTSTLGFDSSIWDFSNVESGGLPKLKNLDPNNITDVRNRTPINNVEEFLKINSNNYDDFILMTDLDLTGISSTNGTSIIANTYYGTLEANGHKIINSKYALFNSINGVIKNLKIENSAITSANAKGILANSINSATIENVSINNSSIINNNNQVGGLSGSISSSTINKISLTNITVNANNTLGGLAGQINNTAVYNILVTGKVKGTLGHRLGSRAGGITGWLSNGSSINNVVVKAEVNGQNKAGNGGLIGGPDSGNVIIKNSISLSTGTNSYRIAGFNTLNGVTNVYEYASSNSATNINQNNSGKVLSASAKDVANPEFYQKQVKLDAQIWNFSTVKTLGYPTLK